MNKQKKKKPAPQTDTEQPAVRKFADQLQQILGRLPAVAEQITELLGRWEQLDDGAPGLLGGNLLTLMNEAVMDEQVGRLSNNAAHRRGEPEALADHTDFFGGLLAEYAALIKVVAGIELEENSQLFRDWDKIADQLLQYASEIQDLAEQLEIELEGKEEPESPPVTASRHLVQEIWKKSQAGRPLTGEQARLGAVLKEHPEYRVAWESAGQAGESTLAGVNPFVHASMHVVVENQLAEGNPPETAAVLTRLMAAGLSRHEAVHRIGNVAIEHIWRTRRENRPFDRAAYIRALKELK